MSARFNNAGGSKMGSKKPQIPNLFNSVSYIQLGILK